MNRSPNDAEASMQINQAGMNDVVASIYAAVSHRDGFTPALRSLRILFRATRATLITPLVQPGVFTDFDPIQRRDEPHAPGGAQLLKAPGVGNLMASRRATPRGKTDCCSAGLAQGAQSRTCCCVNIRTGGSEVPAIHLSLTREVHPFAEQERRTLQRLGTHMLHALQLSQRLCNSEMECRIAREALEDFDRGVVIVDCRREVVLMNRRAAYLCTPARGVLLRKGPYGNQTLHTTFTEEELALTRAIDAALLLVPEARQPQCGSVSVQVHYAAGHRPLLFRVAPLPTGIHRTSTRDCYASLCIVDLAEMLPGDIQSLRRLFGLTAAEARVASALLVGERPKAIARRFAVSEDTVRSQLRAVYEKTETKGVASLVALLARLPRASSTQAVI